MKEISIIIPALNEEEGIGSVIDAIKEVMLLLRLEYEILVIDDGSVDGTGLIAKQKGAKVIRHPYSSGYGASIQKGIELSIFDTIGIIDADGTYPVKSFIELFKYIEDYDMVVGARTGKHYRESFWKYPSRKIFQLLCEFVAGRRIPDPNSGMRIFKRNAVLKFKDNLCQGFSFSTTITLEMLINGNFIKFVPIEFYKRKGKSKIHIIRDTLRTTQILTQTILYVNPIKLFLILTIALIIAAFIFLIIFIFSKNSWAILLFGASLISTFNIMSLGFIAELLRKIKTNEK